MNPPSPIILVLCVAAALSATWTNAAAPPAVNASSPRQGLIPAGPAPTGLAASGTPLVASLSWNAMPGAQRYAVYRLDSANLSVQVTPAGFTAIQFQDVVPDPRMTYRYVVIAYYPNGTSGESPQVQFLSPPPINPGGFSVHDQGQGTVLFQWQAVPGTLTYRLDGPGLPSTGHVVTVQTTGKFVGNSFITTAPNIPAGPGSWRLVALYPGNYADYPNGSIASAVVHVLPPPSLPWLSKPNNVAGLGLPSQVQTPQHQTLNDTTGGSAVGNRSGDLFPTYDPNYATWLGQDFQWSTYDMEAFCGINCAWAFRPDVGIVENPGDTGFTYSPGSKCVFAAEVFSSRCHIQGLRVWLNMNTPLWDQPEQASREAVYGNPGDLGVGRRAYCEQKIRGPPEPGNFTVVPGIYTVCYATAHGARPGQPGYNDPYAIRNPSAGVGSDFILSMVIIKDSSGTVFLVLGSNAKYTLLPTVGLDTQGQKLVPFVCASCHGGKYNPITRKVDGASFLPIDPELLAFSTAADQAAQEEKIRQINWMIFNSGSSPVIASYVNGLYNGALAQPGARATPDFVPSGWAPQAGFYRQIVRPYCAMCHMAVAGTNVDLNFASWTNFQGNAGLIQASVCGAHTMPHSELQYKAFWLKDTGPLYLPGLLAATLGFPSC